MAQKRAFTLIELLVVIAIIAILAAILFPVFAQAKEAAKKTTYIANVKQTGTAIQIYLADFDDTFPLTLTQRPDRTWFNGLTPVPYNGVADAVWSTPERQAQASTHWANAAQPYMKNFNIYELPVGGTTQVAGEVFNTAVPRVKVGMNMNGYLHTWSATAIANPSVLPVLWSVQKVNFLQRSLSTPALSCAGTGGCQWHPTTSVSSYFVYNFTDTVWQFGRRGVFGRADSSAKVAPMGTTVDPQFVSFESKLADPYAGVSATGTPISLWSCNADQTNTGNSWCYFRPDREQ